LPLQNWLLEDEGSTFSIHDSISNIEIAITNLRSIFYKSGLTREDIESYDLRHIAGHRIQAVRKTIIAIGLLVTMLGILVFFSAFRGFIEYMKSQHMIIQLLSSLTLILIIGTGIATTVHGLSAYHVLELTVAGRKITKYIRTSREDLIELSHKLIIQQM
jgi:hypothetical protein